MERDCTVTNSEMYDKPPSLKLSASPAYICFVVVVVVVVDVFVLAAAAAAERTSAPASVTTTVKAAVRC